MAAQPNRGPAYRDMLDIVFANRNRAYGAYLLRRDYPKHLRNALLYGLLLIAAAFAIPMVLNAVNELSPFEPPTEIVAEIGPPPVIEKLPEEPVIETQAPPARSQQRLVPPDVRQDNLVPEERQLSNEVLLAGNDDIGAKTQTGNNDAPPALIDNPVELRFIEEPKRTVDDNTYETIDVQKPPFFPGGETELLKYLAKNIKYPPMAVENRIVGNVVLSFVVNKDGSVSDVTILRDIGGGCGKEAVRVVNNMPNWSPGEANGHPVKVRYRIPVKFQLQ